MAKKIKFETLDLSTLIEYDKACRNLLTLYEQSTRIDGPELLKENSDKFKKYSEMARKLRNAIENKLEEVNDKYE